TIIKEKGDLTVISRLKLYHHIPAALKNLQKIGYKLIIITNQSLIARGLISEKKLNYIHLYLKKLLAKKGVRINGIYYCPHHPTKGVIKRYSKVCNCRKPEPGMVQKAVRDFNIDPKRSFFIGDSLRDLECARKTGVRFILVLTGVGKKTLKELSQKHSFIAGNLLKASKLVRELN
ncbi:MAG: HAD-IIIA family hydrolase, partial [Planctomycetota bacterium]|nr:HAD-IIIA family hydrolase [Planctomycetota bacterium]